MLPREQDFQGSKTCYIFIGSEVITTQAMGRTNSKDGFFWRQTLAIQFRTEK